MAAFNLKQVGTYEDVDVLICSECNELNVMPCIYTTLEEFEPYQQYEPWFCSFCNIIGNPPCLYGKRFQCPDCNNENLQVLEPSLIHTDNDDKFFYYIKSRITCMYCESEFGLCVNLDGNRILYKEEYES